jgi:hypothetical protein
VSIPDPPGSAAGPARVDRRTLLAGGLALAGLSIAGPAAAREPPSEPHRRAEWAGTLRPKGPLEVEDRQDVLFLLVHHSVSTNTYAAGQVPELLRGIYRSHTGPAKRWPDVAYNFFVDRFGGVWEGRQGSLEAPVKGSATGGSQGFALLCCFLGDHRRQRPSAAALEAMTALLTGLAVKYDIDTTPGARTRPFRSRGSNRWPAGTVIRARTISGHREMSLTECPGDAGFAVVRDYLPKAVTELRGGRSSTGAAGAPAQSSRAGGGGETATRPEARSGNAPAPAGATADEGQPLAPLVLPSLALAAGLGAAATVVRRRRRAAAAGHGGRRPAPVPAPATVPRAAAPRPVNVGASSPAAPVPAPVVPGPAPAPDDPGPASASVTPVWRVVGGLEARGPVHQGQASLAVRHVRIDGILAVAAAEGSGPFHSSYGPRAAVGSIVRDARLLADRARQGLMDLDNADPEWLFRALVDRARSMVLHGATQLGVAPDRWTTTLSCVLAYGRHVVCGQVGGARIVVQTHDHGIRDVAAAPGGANGHPRNLTAADALDLLTVELLAAADVRCFALSVPAPADGAPSPPRLSLHELLSLAGQGAAGENELQSVTRVHDRTGDRQVLAVAAQGP